MLFGLSSAQAAEPIATPREFRGVWVATVDAVKRMLVAVPVHATCTVRIGDGTKLFIDVEEVQMLGAAVQSMVQAQMDQMNPVVDLTDLPWRVSLSEAVIEAGMLTVRGTAAPRA